MRRRFVLIIVLGFLAFAAIALGLHATGLNAPLYYDSSYRLEFKLGAFADQGLMKVIDIFPQRPIPMATFYYNYLATGMSPFWFRAVNLMLLATLALVLAVTLHAFLELGDFADERGSSERRAVAIGLSLLFVAHPLQIYVTLYIWQRMALMACLFYYSALAVYLAARTERIRNVLAGYAACYVLFVFALASKENAVTLPLVLVLADIAFFKDKWRPLAKRAFVFALGLILAAALLSLLERPHGEAGDASGILQTIVTYYKESGLTIKQVAFTQCRVVFHYLSTILAPTVSKVQLSQPQIISSSLWDPPATLLAVIGVSALVGTGIYLLRRRPLSGFGILFFVINLLPESLLVPQYLYLGYRAVLPMLGILLVLGDCVLLVLKWAGPGQGGRLTRYVTASVLCLAMVFLGWTTVNRALLWSDPPEFWRDAVTGFPESGLKVEKQFRVQALNSLGRTCLHKNSPAEALLYHQEALRISPHNAYGHYYLGKTLFSLGRLPEAIDSYQQAMKNRPDFAEAHGALALVLVRLARLDEALVHARKAIEMKPFRAELHYGLGTVLLRKGLKERALESFNRAVELDPRSGQAQYQLGQALLKTGRPAEAIIHLKLALELNPKTWEAHNNLGVAFARLGKPQLAVKHFQLALRINPADAAAKNNLATVLKSIRETKERVHR